MRDNIRLIILMAAKVKIIRHIGNHLLWIFDFYGHRESIGFQFMLVSALGRLLPGVFGIWRTMSKCGQGARCQKKCWHEFERIYKITYSCLMADRRYFPQTVIFSVSKFELLVAELAITVSCLQISKSHRKFPKNTHPANMSAKDSSEKRQQKFPQRWPHPNPIQVEEAGGIWQSGWKSS